MLPVFEGTIFPDVDLELLPDVNQLVDIFRILGSKFGHVGLPFRLEEDLLLDDQLLFDCLCRWYKLDRRRFARRSN